MNPIKTMKFSPGALALVCLVGVLIGWFARGFIVPEAPAAAPQGTAQNTPPAPTPESVSPAQGSGSRQTFTVTVSAPQGYTTIHSVGMLINSAIMASHSCYPQYDVATGNAGLIADSGDSVLAAPAHSGVKLENSQCVVDSAAITAHGEGNKVAISIPVTFKPAFAGAKSILVIATNAAGKSSELEMKGSWTVADF